MFHNILIPLDGSEMAPGILPYVACLSRGLNIPVELTTILVQDHLDALEKESRSNKDDAESFLDGLLEASAADDRDRQVAYWGVVKKSGDGYSPWVIRNAVQPAGRYLGQLVGQLNNFGIEARAVVCVGDSVSEGVLRVARQDGCDLIAMATHNRNTLMQAIQGSFTIEIIRSRQGPVLAFSPHQDGPVFQDNVTLTNILVPLDGSRMAESVLPYVEELASQLSLQIELVTIVQEQNSYVGISSSGDPVHPRLPEDGEAIAADAGDSQRYLRGIADDLERKGIRVQWNIIRGPTDRSLEKTSGQLSNNLIALASHGRSGLDRWVMGSVAEDLIRKTGDPVLIIPAAELE